jgi:hypothetical protein
MTTNRATLTVCAWLILGSTALAAAWQHPFYLPGDSYWHARARLTVRNDTDSTLEGRALTIQVGKEAGSLDIVGTPAQAIRVCDDAGTEMLFALADPLGQRVTAGPVTAGGTLTIPAQCAAKSQAVYWVYFDNPGAQEVPDFLDVRRGLINGDVEDGEGEVPAGWNHDAPDPQHRATWSTDHPKSGKRCLKTVVSPGAQATWVATRQHGIQIIGGARYQMTAWVKADNVKGNAGWYLHVGNASQGMLLSPMLHGGSGTYDWKEVKAEFTAPADADRADLGTVLRGTGTAWFDLVSLESLSAGQITLTADRPERMALKDGDTDEPWHSIAGPRSHRAVIDLYNFTSQPQPHRTVPVVLSMIKARMCGRLVNDSILIVRAGQIVPCQVTSTAILLQTEMAPMSRQRYYAYFDSHEVALPAGARLASSAEQLGNLVQNPSFEQGDGLPGSWTKSGEGKGVKFSLDEAAPGEGRRSARFDVPANVAKNWRGWTQQIAIQGGHTYLISAWMKCRDVDGGRVSIHVHFLDAAGKLCRDHGMRSFGDGVEGTAVWTLQSDTFRAPADAAKMSIHLTMNGHGTLWHDAVDVSEVTTGTITRLDGKPVGPEERIKVWPVNAVVKVFPDDAAPPSPATADISLARNEKEPLQLAIRSGRAAAGVRVEVSPLVGPGGANLDAEVGIVGYVPIDYPSGYFSSDTPVWHRKFPTSGVQCDGWAGLWPDPILPDNSFSLAPNHTTAVWITVTAGKNAPAGEYRSTVRLNAEGKTLAKVPVCVRVKNFTLPDENHVAAIYDVRATTRKGLWTGPKDELWNRLARFMHDHRLCPDRIGVAPKIEYVNGRVVADFTEFDQAATVYFDQLKFPFSYTPAMFYMFGWGHPPAKKFGQLPYPGDPPYEGADRSQLRPEFREAYKACLRVFWDHVKEKGWQHKFILYISDEPYDRQEIIQTQMKALCDLIHEVDPSIPIYSSTWHHVPVWDGYLNVWGIGHFGKVPMDLMEKLRAGGARIWFTTDGQMCTDTPYCAFERLMPHFCWKCHAAAYEFWGMAWLTYNPFRYGWHAYIHQSGEPGKFHWVRYPNGDGFFTYPGESMGRNGIVTTIRCEQAREGVEDYEYLHLLASLVKKAKEAGRDASIGERALAQADALVSIPNAGGRYSSKVLPDPDAVFTLRQTLADAIEQLSTK